MTVPTAKDEFKEMDVLSCAVQAIKVPNDSKKIEMWFTPKHGILQQQQMVLADKYRGIIKEVPPQRNISFKQIYMDVESDHQHQMLNSNIYIPD